MVYALSSARFERTHCLKIRPLLFRSMHSIQDREKLSKTPNKLHVSGLPWQPVWECDLWHPFNPLYHEEESRQN